MQDPTTKPQDGEPVVVVPATPLFQTTLRQKITPFLPPPVVVAMKRLDPQLEPYIGPEPTVTLMSSFCLALILWQFVKLLSKATGSGRSAIQDDPQDADGNLSKLLQPNKYYDETILFCGPSLVGKTSLFYALLDNNPSDDLKKNKKKKRTVKSLQPNTGFYNNNNNDNNNKTILLLDLPGYWDTDKVVTTIQEKSNGNKPTWIVVVLDATQSVSKVVDHLYKILLSTENPAKVIIACNKSKAPKAKNVRRIKLQLRSELERLSKLANNSEHDWESMLNDIPLCATSCDPILLHDLFKALQEG